MCVLIQDGSADTGRLLDARLWLYKGEGNANIVLSYMGKDVNYVGYVLRLSKVRDDSEGPEPYSLVYARDYHEKVIAPLLGNAYISHMAFVGVSRDFLSSIAEMIGKDRPATRKHKDVDLDQQHAALIPDHTVISSGSDPSSETPAVISFEIKPKWGFLPTSCRVSQLKRSTCRYCMHQQLKAAQDDAHTPNGFCPLDLFSHSPERMRHSLSCLFRNPQNNLKLFVNGRRLTLNSHESTTSMLDFISRLYPSNTEQTNQEDPSAVMVDLLAQIARDDGWLQNLRFHQQHLDPYDIETVYRWYVALDDTMQGHNPTTEEWEDIISAYVRRVDDIRTTGLCEDSSAPDNVGDVDMGTSNPINRLRAIYEFLISATLKDCSALITMWVDEHSRGDGSNGPTNGEGLLTIANSPHLLRYKIRIVDIDPKDIHKIPRYFDLDQRIIR
ncbi:inositol-pentakisphosphate 2-kinase [Gaertneriomyces semiglobifer]|nr:inositol-pentakisphosphate 2-kinase [Gaertneriomyces semiglobifer]